jgi:hypothetical protein
MNWRWPKLLVQHDSQASPESGWFVAPPGVEPRTDEWYDAETYVALSEVREALLAMAAQRDELDDALEALINAAFPSTDSEGELK